ncbi:MAG: acyltransferase family protein [Myxococcota bacterium]
MPNPNSRPAPSARRHDLDALRAIAMLLGIVIHAAFAMLVVPSPTADLGQSEWVMLIVDVIHGFRMPLFFMVSGFFTAMLWRKRGLGALVRHRFRRIFLPFALGMVTVLPLTLGAMFVGGERGAKVAAARPAQTDIWTAAARGDVEAMKAHRAAGANIDEPDPFMVSRPLVWAATGGHVEAATWLLDQGVDLHAQGDGGFTALHAAALMGRPRVVALLLARGADANAMSRGMTALAMAGPKAEDWVSMLSSMYGVEQDPQAVSEGRAESARLLRLHDPEAADSEPSLADSIAAIPTMHLWFLWYLCWFVAGFVVVAWILERVSCPRPPAWLVLSPARYLWLIPLTLLPQLFMAGFGPGPPGGLIVVPNVVMGYYAIFFGFGALYYTYDDPEGRISQEWRLALPLGVLLVLPLGLWLDSTPERDDWVLYCVLQVTYAWLMIFGSMGLFRRYLGRERNAMRYTSDASYWIYLAHLPLMFALQMVMQSWPVPPLVIVAINCVVTTVILLFIYDKLVRYRWLGRFLNGPRTRPAAAQAPR